MAWTHGLKCEALKAEVSFSGMQYRIVELSTSQINAAKLAAGGGGYGVLQNEPLANEHATVAREGMTRLKAGVAIGIGDYVTCAVSATGGSGWATKVVSGDTGPVTLIGRARSSAASGSIFTCELDIRRLNVSSDGEIVI